MTGYRDRDHFDRLQDMRAEHAAETGEPMSLAEAMRRLVNNVNTSGHATNPTGQETA